MDEIGRRRITTIDDQVAEVFDWPLSKTAHPNVSGSGTPRNDPDSFGLGRTALPFGEPPEAAAGIRELHDNLIDTTGRFRAPELHQ